MAESDYSFEVAKLNMAYQIFNQIKIPSFMGDKVTKENYQKAAIEVAKIITEIYKNLPDKSRYK